MKSTRLASVQPPAGPVGLLHPAAPCITESWGDARTVPTPGDPITGEHRHINGRDMPVYLKADLDRMKKIRSYKGIRHNAGLRFRGQHTRTTGRGGRAVGVTRRKATQE